MMAPGLAGLGSENAHGTSLDERVPAAVTEAGSNATREQTTYQSVFPR